MLSEKQSYLSNNPLLIQAVNNAVRRRIERERSDAVLMARRAGIVPDQWQSDLLRSEVKQMILNCSRQSGKSTTSAALAVHQAVYQSNSLTLLIAPSLRQSQELFRKVKDILIALESPFSPQITEESSLRLELANGSRIVSLPGSEQTIRGFSSVGLLIVDEAAVCEDALFFSIKPMLAVSGGRVILLSTPRGKRGFFFDAWENGGDDWQRIKITAEQCPRISPQWLENERRVMPDFWFRQEFLCQFVETSDQIFSYDDIYAALDDTIEPLFPAQEYATIY